MVNSMKLNDITKNLSDMTEDELRAHVQHIRHTKYVAKPAKAKRVQETVKKETRQKTTTLDKSLNVMSDAEKQQLILMLESGEDNG